MMGFFRSLRTRLTILLTLVATIAYGALAVISDAA